MFYISRFCRIFLFLLLTTGSFAILTHATAYADDEFWFPFEFSWDSELQPASLICDNEHELDETDTWFMRITFTPICFKCDYDVPAVAGEMSISEKMIGKNYYRGAISKKTFEHLKDIMRVKYEQVTGKEFTQQAHVHIRISAEIVLVDATRPPPIQPYDKPWQTCFLGSNFIPELSRHNVNYFDNTTATTPWSSYMRLGSWQGAEPKPLWFSRMLW